MNDIEPVDPYASTKSLAKRGVSAVGFLAAGAFLFVMNVLGTRLPLVGFILGGITAVVGIAALFSKDPDDKKPGIVLTAAGALVILSRTGAPFFRAMAPTLLSIGAVAFIAMGIWNGIKFLRGLKKRS